MWAVTLGRDSAFEACLCGGPSGADCTAKGAWNSQVGMRVKQGEASPETSPPWSCVCGVSCDALTGFSVRGVAGARETALVVPQGGLD